METLCVRVRLEPGSLPRVREWAAELNGRRDEVMATLETHLELLIDFENL